ncbi:MAG: HDIG domain-containing protein [candidate division Zixibacteria bacterium]|nr:HDIG domain-containing protein [candidate division Zixibacteria bacterium]
MYTILLKLKRRIKKLLKVQTGSRQIMEQTRRSVAIRYLLLIVTASLISVLYPGRFQDAPIDLPRLGAIAGEDIIAPFDITVYKSARDVAAEREQVRTSVPLVLDEDTAVTSAALQSLDRFVAVAESLRVTARPAEAADSLMSRFATLSRVVIENSLLTSTDLRKVQTTLKKIFSEDIYAVGVLNSIDDLPESQARAVIVRRGERETIVGRGRLLDLALAYARLLTALNHYAATDGVNVEYYYHLGRSFIQPNLHLNMVAYNRQVAEELAHVSQILETVNAGDTIVPAHHRVGKRETAVLDAMTRLQRQMAYQQSWWLGVLPMVARILLVLAVLGVMYIFLYHFRREIFRSNPKLLAILTILGLQLFMMYVADLLRLSSIYVYPVAILPVMITVLFDTEVGLFATVVLALMLGVTHRFDFSLALMTMVIGTVACISSRGVRRRGHFYRIMFSVVLTYIAYVITVETLRTDPSEDLLSEVIYGVAAGTLGVLLTIGFLPVIESMFSITTDITLLELSDLNHPILKRLAMEAPGTYHHVIQVGNLSETAAKAIGANSLLARVGSYYHDIGKIEIPEYFVENQLGVKSRHESLTPSMSAMVLSSHVKKGRQLGEEADIPDDVLNFIEEHHGTLVMSYFYNRAVQQGADPSVIEKFRYPGPKPQTRETGIVMLADAIEAASRTLDDPKPARIDALIQRIINERFQSGELDECPLTLRDLARIKEAFAHVVIAAFHQRIHYPKRDAVV